MKLRGILIVALFPFLHATSYEATFVRCEANKIFIKSQESEFEVTLFNTKITRSEGMEKTCTLLKEANTIRFELDPSSKVEVPMPVYLFADNTLIQEEIIKDGYAYPMIRNPEYTYEKRLESANDTKPTMANPTSLKKKKSYPFVAPIYFGVCFFIWLVMALCVYKKFKK